MQISVCCTRVSRRKLILILTSIKGRLIELQLGHVSTLVFILLMRIINLYWDFRTNAEDGEVTYSIPYCDFYWIWFDVM